MSLEALVIAEEKMQASLNNFKSELAGLRTGRASTGLVENLKINYADVPTPLSHLASLSIQGSSCIVIQPWDKSMINGIMKDIMKSDIGIMPNSDGLVIRLIIPPLNEERRTELIKIASKRSEECKIAIRNIRRNGMEEIKKLEKEAALSQDESKKASEKLQAITDIFIAKASQIFNDKEKELREV